MPRTLRPEELGLSEAEIEEARADRDKATRNLQEAGRRIEIDGKAFSAEEQNYAAIVDAVRASLTSDFLSTPPSVAELSRQLPRRKGKRNSGGRGVTAARRPRLTPTQMAAVGLAGEIAAFEWVKANYPEATEASWRSGYRNLLLGGSEGDDSLGYDFEVISRQRRLTVRDSSRQPGTRSSSI